MNENTPDHTAIRVALWRALHLKIDPPPHVFSDDLGAKLVDEKDWLNRPDMNPDFSKPMRASIVARARFIEDLVEEKLALGINQYVILGAGLDTFAQRRDDLAFKMQIFEIDQPQTQSWKKKRLQEIGYPASKHLHFVPVDFEAGQSWPEELLKVGFDKNKPALVVSTGVSLYLSEKANRQTLKEVASLSQGSTLAMTFMLALELLEEKERKVMEFVMQRAQEAKTPFLSLFKPADIKQMALETGFKQADYVSAQLLYKRYFQARTDGLRAGQAEAFLVASN